jgi:ABC-type phosphonate transport system ATPase subunit
MLLGRDHEQQALDRLLEDARAGNSRVLATVGEAGIGKSALLAYASGRAGISLRRERQRRWTRPQRLRRPARRGGWRRPIVQAVPDAYTDL